LNETSGDDHVDRSCEKTQPRDERHVPMAE